MLLFGTATDVRADAIAPVTTTRCTDWQPQGDDKGGSPHADLLAQQSLVRLCPGLYADRAFAPERRAALRRAVDAARERNLAFFGTLKSPEPDTIVCQSEDCRGYFAGPTGRSITLARGHAAPGARFRASGYVIVVAQWPATQRGEDAEAPLAALLTHERLHVELDVRKGAAGFVPAWFNEGLATWVSGSPTCDAGASTGPAGPGGREVPMNQLLTQPQWDERTAAGRPAGERSLYCRARDEVDAWILRHGAQRVVELLDAIGSGRQSFFQGYGPMLTVP